MDTHTSEHEFDTLAFEVPCLGCMQLQEDMKDAAHKLNLLESRDAQVAAVVSRCTELTEKLKSCHVEREQHVAEIEELKRKNSQLASHVQSLNGSVAKLAEAKKAAEVQSQSLRQQLVAAKAAADQTKSRYDLQGVNVESKRRIAELKEKLKAATDRENDLQRQLREHQIRNQSDDAELKRLRKEIHDLKYKSAPDAGDQLLSMLQTQKLQKNHDELLIKFQNLQNKCSSVEKELSSLRSRQTDFQVNDPFSQFKRAKRASPAVCELDLCVPNSCPSSIPSPVIASSFSAVEVPDVDTLPSTKREKPLPQQKLACISKAKQKRPAIDRSKLDLHFAQLEASQVFPATLDELIVNGNGLTLGSMIANENTKTRNSSWKDVAKRCISSIGRKIPQDFASQVTSMERMIYLVERAFEHLGSEHSSFNEYCRIERGTVALLVEILKRHQSYQQETIDVLRYHCVTSKAKTAPTYQGGSCRALRLLNNIMNKLAIDHHWQLLRDTLISRDQCEWPCIVLSWMMTVPSKVLCAAEVSVELDILRNCIQKQLHGRIHGKLAKEARNALKLPELEWLSTFELPLDELNRFLFEKIESRPEYVSQLAILACRASGFRWAYNAFLSDELLSFLDKVVSQSGALHQFGASQAVTMILATIISLGMQVVGIDTDLGSALEFTISVFGHLIEQLPESDVMKLGHLEQASSLKATLESACALTTADVASKLHRLSSLIGTS